MLRGSKKKYFVKVCFKSLAEMRTEKHSYQLVNKTEKLC
jgi:hypothetical protein